jgi:hypothetical protein
MSTTASYADNESCIVLSLRSALANERSKIVIIGPRFDPGIPRGHVLLGQVDPQLGCSDWMILNPDLLDFDTA